MELRQLRYFVAALGLDAEGTWLPRTDPHLELSRLPEAEQPSSHT